MSIGLTLMLLRPFILNFFLIFEKFVLLYLVLTPQYFVQVRNATLHINEVGNPKGEKLMILLHGFLGTGLVEWKYQLLYYANSTEYRVVSPDLRGFNTSSKSEDVYFSNWGQSTLDIAELIGLLGYKNATVTCILDVMME